MSAEAWTAIATGIGVVLTLGGGFTVWMRRVERAVVKASELPEQLATLKTEIMKAIDDLRSEKREGFEAVWRRLEDNAASISKHGERLATLEAKGRRQ